jgi:hypothetical protein
VLDVQSGISERYPLSLTHKKVAQCSTMVLVVATVTVATVVIASSNGQLLRRPNNDYSTLTVHM